LEGTGEALQGVLRDQDRKDQKPGEGHEIQTKSTEGWTEAEDQCLSEEAPQPLPSKGREQTVPFQKAHEETSGEEKRNKRDQTKGEGLDPPFSHHAEADEEDERGKEESGYPQDLQKVP
jgi:hypothetical protein